jgi:four helix bundle protein
MEYKDFQDMTVWQQATKLAEEIFNLSEDLPQKEDYGLTSQVRRAALSVSGNIAEGFGRGHIKDKINFYLHSRGSLSEVKSHLLYGLRVGYFAEEKVNQLIEIINNIWEELNKLIASLKLRINST